MYSVGFCKTCELKGRCLRMPNYDDMRNVVDESTPYENNHKPNNRKKKFIIIAIICAAVLLIAAIILLIFFMPNNKEGSNDTPSQTESIVSDENLVSDNSTASDNDNSIPEIEDDPSIKGYFVNDVFIYNKEGYEIFGGNNTLAATYATILSDITDRLDSKITVYNMIVPTHGEFNLPSRYKQMAKSQKDNIEKVYSSYSANIIPVDIYDTLNRHKLEYIYYHTDHQWTALGAYYGYEQFANVYGFEPVALEDLNKGEIEGFKGLFIDSTDGNEDLLSNPDTVEYYEIPGNYTCRLLENGADELVRVPLLYPYSQGGSYTYSKFIWGDNPYMNIKNSDVKNGKKLLIIKDSYGNVFVPYLVPNFEEIHIIDYRYYKDNVSDIIKDNGITDVLFINGIMSVNSSYHQNKLIELKW